MNSTNGIGSRVTSLLAVLLAFTVANTAWAESKRYIVTFKSSDRYQAASVNWEKSERLAALGLATPSANAGMTLLNTTAKVIKALDQVEMMIVETDREDVAEQLARHPSIANVEPEIFFPNPTPVNKVPVRDGYSTYRRTQSCSVDRPWGIGAVKADKAWATTKGGGARVLVLDTGFDKQHPDLKSRFEKGRNFTSEAMANTNTDVEDKIGHGTHVSGTIAADGTCVIGVAPEAKILAGKVCEDRGCSTTAVIEGIDWGIAEKVDVISMSLGGPLALPSQQRAVERAEQARVVIVAATGNDGVRRVSYPGAYPTVIAVGAIADDRDFKRAEFSQYGPELDIMAPGVDVLSSVPMGAGRISLVHVDLGDGKSNRVKSVSFAGAPQNSSPITGQFVHAGLGKPGDFPASVRGKFALIERGEIAFQEKVENAMSAGATGVVIYNNAAGLARGSLGEEGTINIPVAMIEQATGQQIRDLVSRGTNVTASIVTEEADYDSFDGTSMATPHVSGVVALVRAANSKLTPAEVREAIRKSATQLGNADEYGAGLVNADAAVRAAMPMGLATSY
jgi:serine protease